MGLDMHLHGKRYISATFTPGDNEISEKIAELFPELKEIPSQFRPTPVKELTAEIGYWRKANAIHRWFVDKVQDGEDDCGYHYVDRSTLEELRELCEEVLANRDQAGELLPPQAGFFFGSQEIDEGYFADIEHTIEVIDHALALPESWDFEYHSSW